MVAPPEVDEAIFALELGSDPLNAASRLKGRAEAEENEGGSIRVKGAEIRREAPPTPRSFLLRDLPAGAVNGARGEDIFRRRGVESARGEADAEGGAISVVAGMGLAVVKLKVNDFCCLRSNAFPFVFFEGESNIAGSTFSLSKSSKLQGSYARLLLAPVVFMLFMFVLPDFCAAARLTPLFTQPCQ